MLKCKDCLHHEVCRKWYVLTGHSAKEADEISELEYEYEGNFCTYSKGKSLIAELPCRVGDTVYILIGKSKQFGRPYIKEEKVTEVSTAGRIWTDSCYYDVDDFDRAVFLTREDAERALKECEKNETD